MRPHPRAPSAPCAAAPAGTCASWSTPQSHITTWRWIQGWWRAYWGSSWAAAARHRSKSWWAAPAGWRGGAAWAAAGAVQGLVELAASSATWRCQLCISCPALPCPALPLHPAALLHVGERSGRQHQHRWPVTAPRHMGPGAPPATAACACPSLTPHPPVISPPKRWMYITWQNALQRICVRAMARVRRAAAAEPRRRRRHGIAPEQLERQSSECISLPCTALRPGKKEGERCGSGMAWPRRQGQVPLRRGGVGAAEAAAPSAVPGAPWRQQRPPRG